MKLTTLVLSIVCMGAFASANSQPAPAAQPHGAAMAAPAAPATTEEKAPEAAAPAKKKHAKKGHEKKDEATK